VTTLPPLDLRQLRVLVAHPRDAEGEVLLRQLQRSGARVECVWPAPPALPTGIDVLFALLGSEPKGALAWLGSPPPCALVALFEPADAAGMRNVVDCSPQAVIVKPIAASCVLPSLALAHANFRYERRLLSKIGKLEETLRSMRKVEQAKSILMKQKRLPEPEAYRYLRQQAMNRRVSIGAVASAIIEAADILREES